MKRTISRQIHVTRLGTAEWQWSARAGNWIIDRGTATGRDFAFCHAVRAIMRHDGMTDETGLLAKYEAPVLTETKEPLDD